MKLEILKTELTENRRYGLILRAVQLGLKELGVKDVTISVPREEDGRFVFDMERKLGV
jgi:hypothetical protein